ncbi:uncharacterized protein LOC117104124 [Anneissia japonica]|uniref:uncharacterized protein LOC117104124 n=1 Tax=Anneissia japonica TaxID=1529436 RepID=UPI001425518F|nr:uncharacterized protein LOC117104124 [Anneissia japonica]XP_033100690.1 uncharacterized protein LOC117104124 [Anneissia japonica]XP_033100691.1 uncharacterized protein LOC117104124 [Anneissia japonica]XP_033100692.1 uncharacterized protein LOC117104124 [Anneissia japonica]XP_033100693.1 uncharacterized protein LOC117104124 [Anneissia japonica]XP_033100694.1 uncharacterized protein LOC117104124 [Anneissia japonica]XP_033100695.1 uncharacterized protein LOC117104124 [Anneissia japonica]
MIKLESEDYIDHETYQQLRLDCEKNEKLLSSIGFEVMKTTSNLTLIQFYEKRFFSTKMAIIVDKEFNIFVSVHNKHLSENHLIFERTKTIYIFNDLVMFLKKFEKFVVCIGNSDIPYDMPQRNAYVEHDHGAVYSQTIRVNQCTLLTDRTNRCSYCSKFRGTLQRANRKRKPCEVSLTSNRPNSAMTKEYLIEKAKMLKKQCESVEGKNRRLRHEIDRKNKNNEMIEDTNWDISGLVHEESSTLQEVLPDPESFQRLFWEEQIKFNNLKDKRQIRRHPLIVKCEPQTS